MKEKIKRVLAWGPALLWMGVIFTLSSQSDPINYLAPGVSSTIEDGSFILEHLVDLIFHPLEYGILTILLFCGIVEWDFSNIINTNQAMWTSSLTAIIYGLVDEIHQLYVPGRSFQALDLLLDCTGAAGGAIIMIGLKRIYLKNIGTHNIDQYDS